MNAEFLNEAAICEKAWESSGLLNGIADEHTRKVTAVMLENQKLLNEQGTDTSDVAQFKRISIPLVRRIYPQLIANKIVSVQPLLGPTGLVYYLRFRYSSNKGSVRGSDLNSGFPTDDVNSLMQKANGDANCSIYYSHQYVENESTTTDAGGHADFKSIFAPLEKTPILAGSMTGSIYDGAVLVQTFTVSQTGTFTFVDSGTPTTKVVAGSLNVTTGELTLTWNADPEANHAVVSYEYNMECNQDLPEVNMVIENEEIVAKTRKLKAVWSFESQQDLRSQHNLDAEAELTAILAQEINLEIDREILADLRSNAGTVAAWNFGSALGDTIKEKYESLYVKVVEVSNVIHRKTLRGSANWLVTSPEIASMFETATAGFAPAPSDTFNSTLGVQYVGTINNRWKLYKDPLFPTSEILMGYKGDSYMDSGYFYCPYVPLTQTPVVNDPESFCPRKGILTRYGKKLLREGAKFYGKLTIAGWSI